MGANVDDLVQEFVYQPNTLVEGRGELRGVVGSIIYEFLFCKLWLRKPHFFIAVCMFRLFITRLAKKYFPSIYQRLRVFRYERYVFPREFMAHVNRLLPSNLVIDVGANVGLVTETLARRGVRVISFEPNSSAFLKLKRVARRFPNVSLRNVAAGMENTSRKLYFHKDFENTKDDLTQASSLLDTKSNISQENFELVDEIDFAKFLKSLNEPVELIKIDIEGYEIQLLNHLLDNHALDNVSYLYVETHERRFPDLIASTEKLKERIRREGYMEKFFFDWH